MKGNINPHEVINSISENLKGLDFKSFDGELSETSLNELKQEFAKVQLTAYKAKLSVKIAQLAKTSPELSSKVVLEKMLAHLPVNITPAFLPVLAAHVVERWRGVSFEKVAA